MMEIRTRVPRQICSIYELLPIEIAKNMINKHPLIMTGSLAVTIKSANRATLIEWIIAKLNIFRINHLMPE